MATSSMFDIKEEDREDNEKDEKNSQHLHHNHQHQQKQQRQQQQQQQKNYQIQSEKINVENGINHNRLLHNGDHHVLS